VAKPKNPADRLSPKQVLNFESLENEADWDSFLEAAIPALSLVDDLHQKLLAGAKNEILDENFKPALRLRAVADFWQKSQSPSGTCFLTL
jgi:hypothetical protein